jgi:uncharacterized protein with von Willebrand factor type A (vWA) domain
MLVSFFYHLRAARLPVSVNELLTLLAALKNNVIGPQSPCDSTGIIDDFYYLARTALIKDEAHYDKFDRAFSEFFKGVQTAAARAKEIPDQWFRDVLEREFTPEELARLEKLGFDRLLQEFRQRLEEQDGAHHGGNTWIGTGGTSPFGAGGRHPEGIRVGGPSAGGKSAVKVWEARAYRDYDDQVELGLSLIHI